jgi:hypothetical protein
VARMFRELTEIGQRGELGEELVNSLHAAVSKHEPCRSLDVPSGTYLRMTFLRLYCTRPYNGDFSSYCSTASLASLTPAVPRPSSSTVSRVAYLSRNLSFRRCQLPNPRAKGGECGLPSPSLGESSLVRFDDSSPIQPVQAHCVHIDNIGDAETGASTSRWIKKSRQRVRLSLT